MNRKEAIEMWKRASRSEKDRIYLEVIFPVLRKEFKKKPLEGWGFPEKPRIRALISVLGFSWQPPALMTVWSEPEYVLLIGSEESVSMRVNGKSVVELISNLTGVPIGNIEVFRAGEDELEIYRKVKGFVDSKGINQGEIAVDLTGGKKYMSAVTALAGFLAGCLLMYVDYGEYDPEIRAPLPFSEYPRLIRNPLDIFGDVEKRKVIDAFNSGKFELAAQLARDLRDKLYEAKEMEGLEFLCRSYDRWRRFDFEGAFSLLQRAKAIADRFSSVGSWRWYEDGVKSLVAKNLKVLSELKDAKNKICKKKDHSFKNMLPLIVNHLSMAKAYEEYGEHTVAIMLLYSTVEKTCDAVLLLDHGLEDEAPDYSRIEGVVDWDMFHKKGRAFMGKVYQERRPQGPLTYSIGVQLVAALKPDIIKDQDLPELSGLAQLRNKCEFEHGFCPEGIDRKHFSRYFKVVKGVVNAFIKHFEPGFNLDELLQDFQFPKL